MEKHDSFFDTILIRITTGGCALSIWWIPFSFLTKETTWLIAGVIIFAVSFIGAILIERSSPELISATAISLASFGCLLSAILIPIMWYGKLWPEMYCLIGSFIFFMSMLILSQKK